MLAKQQRLISEDVTSFMLPLCVIKGLIFQEKCQTCSTTSTEIYLLNISEPLTTSTIIHNHTPAHEIDFPI